jgi:hypothetical protein
MRWAIGFTVGCLLTGHASPNDPAIVIVVILVGERAPAEHSGGIIAQVDEGVMRKERRKK